MIGNVKVVKALQDIQYPLNTGVPYKGVLIMGSDGTNTFPISVDNTGAFKIKGITDAITVESTDLDIRSLSNATDDLLVYGFDGTSNQKLATHTDGEVKVKSITDTVVTSELNTDYLRYTAVETLVTAQALTAAYTDYGTEVDMRGYNTIGIWVIADANDSQDVDLKVLGKHTLAGTDEFEIDGLSVKQVWTGVGADSKIYYEFDVGSIPYIQIQAIAGTVGTTAGTLTISTTKSY